MKQELQKSEYHQLKYSQKNLKIEAKKYDNQKQTSVFVFHPDLKMHTLIRIYFIQPFQQFRHMVSCNLDVDCPFMFYCTQKLICQHKPIFPIEWYPLLAYILIPIGAGFVNVVGKSMGILKVTILMNLLRYNASQSTALIQPMVAGAALPNVLTVIFKRHPKRNTSLIDYDIILVIIPCSLLGSTLGSFLQKLVPQLFKDVVMSLFFFSFAYSFYKKSKTFKKTPTQAPPENQENLTQPLQSESVESDPALQLEGDSHLANEGLKILTYQKSLHIPDILLSLLVFIIFQFLVFLAQGKFSFYSIKVCSWEYVVGLAVLVLVVIAYQETVRRKLQKKCELYKKLNIKRNLDLSETRNFGLICFAGYFAGLTQGILGVGSGTFIMGVFMAINLDPRVAAATSSYQILFVGLAAFIEQFITNGITIKDALFLFSLTAVGGGLFTLLLYHLFKKFESRKVNIFLVYVMFGLCLISAIFVIPFLVQIGIQFGIESLIKIPFHC